MTIIWQRPRKSSLVVFDRYGTQGLLPLLTNRDHVVFENRRSHLHIWVLLDMLVRLRFSWRDYCVSYLRLTKPKLVITCIDSNATFYALKSGLPAVSFIAIQNGIRGNGSPIPDGDMWSMLERSRHQPPKVDFVATFGAAHSRMYAERIRCSTIEIGSTRNNMIPVEPKQTSGSRRRIGFISNFSGLPHQGIFPDGSASPVAMYLGGREIHARDYFAADATVAAATAAICAKSGWDLHIIGRRTPEFPFEHKFFADACGEHPFMFIAKRSEEASYQLLDTCDLVIAVDSTLGYEMITRGARVLFVAARALNLGGLESQQFSFGFPGDYPDEGPFWTRSLDPHHLQSLMASLIEMPDHEWRLVSAFVRSELMKFDPDNSLLRNLIAERTN